MSFKRAGLHCTQVQKNLCSYTKQGRGGSALVLTEPIHKLWLPTLTSYTSYFFWALSANLHEAITYLPFIGASLLDSPHKCIGGIFLLSVLKT